MSVTTPLALLGLAFLPVVLAMYLLKLRRDQQPVPSILLWQRLVADVEANAPWQRLRRSLLLLLQLLLVVLLALLAARPFLEHPAGLARDLVLVVDTSASMAATDVLPDRLTAATTAAADRLRDLPAGGTVSLVVAGRTARVAVNATTDLGRVRAALESLRASPVVGDLSGALALADALAARSADAEILVATDGALARTPSTPLHHKVTVVQAGRAANNQAIVALAVRPAASGLTRSVFVSVANLDLAPAERRLQLYGDGVLLEARDMTLDPQTRAEAIIDDVPLGIAVIEVRLAGVDGSSPGTDATGADALALDDRAWAIVPPDRLRRILLVSDGDPYLETALTYLPNTELYGVSPGDYGPSTHPELFDLIIFEGPLPAELPTTPILAIAPATSGPLGEVAGTLTDPGIGTLDPDEPILRYVDLSTTHVGTATKLVLPPWARTVIPGPAGAPLLYAGQLGDRPAAVLAFEPRQSDLPLQVAFPILVSNLAGELMGGSAAPVAAVAPGDPVTLPLPAGTTSVELTRPDGSSTTIPTDGAASLQVTATEALGVYTAVPHVAGGSPGPSVPVPTATGGSASAGETPAASGPSAAPLDPTAPIRFAVDLFDPAESNIAPSSAAAIEALGRPDATASEGDASPDASSGTPAPASPSASGGTGATAADDRPPARDELWVPMILLVLVVLLAEWLVSQRDAVTRLWRSARVRS